MLIPLSNGEATAQIDSDGAWMTAWNIAGQNILFPRQSLMAPDGGSKVRGGCHVCLPNFGPDNDGGLAQHGFGRTLPWQVDYQADNEVGLVLTVPEGRYAGLVAKLTYTLSDAALLMRLTVENRGGEPWPLAPGFHPYFSSDKQQLKLDGQGYDPARLDPAQQLTADAVNIELSGGPLQLRASNLTSWVVWTDRLGDYVCVEPTQSGFSFSNLDEPARVTLRPTDGWESSLLITA